MFQGVFVWGPTPTMTLLVSLTIVLVGGLIFVMSRELLVKRRRNKKTNADGGLGAIDRALSALHSLDKALVSNGSRAIGTAIPHPLLRRVTVSFVLTCLAAASVAMPEPFGLFVVALGLLGVLVVFRHWSRDEDLARELAAKDRLPEPKDRDVAIEGDLTTEVVVACSFVLVFACVAFAQIARAGLGFQLKPDTGPFAFVLYALIELVKAGPLIDYYDLFADQLPFDRLSDVQHSGPWAKAAVLGYRITINLLLLAVLIRVVEIARRRSEGHDLRAIGAELQSHDAAVRTAAIADLKRYTELGRANAAAVLERLIDPRGDIPLPSEMRLELAYLLNGYAEKYGSTGSLYAVITSLRALRKQDFSNNEQWESADNLHACAIQELGARLHDRDRLREAADAFGAREQRFSHSLTPRLGEAQNNLGNALSSLARLSDGEKKKDAYLNAEKTYRRAAETYGRLLDERWMVGEDYAKTCLNLAGLLVERGMINKNNPDAATPPETFFRDAIKVHKIAIDRLGGHSRSGTQTALVRASAETALAETLCELAEMEPDNDEHLHRAVEAFRAALTVRKPDEVPLGWANSQIGLARALHMLGTREKNLVKLLEAQSAAQRVLEVLRGRNAQDTEVEARKYSDLIAGSIETMSRSPA